MLTFKELEKSFKLKYPKGNIYKVNNNKYEIVFHESDLVEYNGTSEKVASIIYDSQINDTKVYTYRVSGLLQLANKLELNDIIDKYIVVEEKIVNVQYEETFNDIMNLFN